jgi:hypothetical protein
LNLKLPAAGGLIALLDPEGVDLDRVTYGPQLTGITTGRLPDGVGAFQQLPFSPTRGASNYLAELGTRLRISEVLARSSTGLDWVEIENVSSASISLARFSFGVNAPGDSLVRWSFRSDAQIGAGERMLLYFGSAPANFVPPPNSHVFSNPLNDQSSELILRDDLDRIIDRVAYGLQISDRSIGRVGQDWVLLATPSPGRSNGTAAAALSAGSELRLNEWFATGGGTNDFVELYNPTTLPVNLDRWILTDDPSISGSTNSRISALTFIEAGAFVRFYADGDRGAGPDHTRFQLDQFGETIRLLNPAGQIIDTIDFPIQWEAASEGRYPDGAQQIVRFSGSISPGAPNYLRPGDADQDGLDDAWELLNGFDPRNPDDAATDADQDGMSNCAEFLSGTNPRDASSFFQIELSDLRDGTPAIRFNVQPGRAYVTEYSDGISPASWARLSEVPPGDSVRTIEVSDSTPISQRPTRFYRVIIQR